MKRRWTKRWSPEIVIEEIKRIYKERKTLRFLDNKGLYDMAYYYFGSFRKAVKKAGLSGKAAGIKVIKKTRHRKWTKELILQEIQIRIENKESLKCKDAHFLCAAARRQFGSYQAALAEFGLDYKKLGMQKWDRETIIQRLKLLYVQGKSFSATDNIRLYNAALYHFGSFRKAIKEAGLTYKKLKTRDRTRKWNKEKIVKELNVLKQKGEPLNVSYLTRHHNRLLGAARYHFGSYKKALKAAGFNPKKERLLKSWSQKKVIVEIRKLKRNKIPLNSTYHNALYKAAKKHFGSYRLALEAAGVGEELIALPRWRTNNWLKNITAEDIETISQRIKRLNS